MTTTAEPLLLRHDDGRGLTTLTLNRPQAFNALSEELLDALLMQLQATTCARCGPSPAWPITRPCLPNAAA